MSETVRGTDREPPGMKRRGQHTLLLRMMDNRTHEIASAVIRAEMETEGLIVPEPGTGKHRITVRGRRRMNPRGD